jgi:hypothetical protein
VNQADLERLLRSAASAGDHRPIEMPFGFDTRVVALSRRNGNGTMFGLARLVRYVAVAAAAVIVLATTGAYFEINRSNESRELFANDFAIADSAIQDEFLQ